MIEATFEAVVPRERSMPIINQERYFDTNGKYEIKSEEGTAMTKVDVEVDIRPAEFNDVNFYDYDGTILYSYSWEEFLEYNQLPPLPTHHEGLVCQEWNWDLQDIVEYITKYHKLNIGASYITDDGDTRIYINIVKNGRMDFPLQFKQSVANGIDIDWGDGSESESFGITDISTTHKYKSTGKYVIRLKPKDDALLLLTGTINSFSVYNSMITEVQIGKNVEKIGSLYFFSCYGLERISVPKSIKDIDSAAFQQCYRLKFFTIPKGFETLKDNIFNNCRSLISVAIPNGVKNVNSGIFRHCYYIKSITFPSTVEVISSELIQYNIGLIYIVLPDGIESIGNNSFYGTTLLHINIPDSVKRIGDYTFYYNEAIPSVIMPSNIEQIGSNAFGYCSGIKYFDFSKAKKVPTLKNSDAFSVIASDCKIIVPDNLYDEWIAATNWSNYASYIIKASEYVES